MSRARVWDNRIGCITAIVTEDNTQVPGYHPCLFKEWSGDSGSSHHCCHHATLCKYRSQWSPFTAGTLHTYIIHMKRQISILYAAQRMNTEETFNISFLKSWTSHIPGLVYIGTLNIDHFGKSPGPGAPKYVSFLLQFKVPSSCRIAAAVHCLGLVWGGVAVAGWVTHCSLVTRGYQCYY